MVEEAEAAPFTAVVEAGPMAVAADKLSDRV
jgi:hypothetical protein